MFCGKFVIKRLLNIPWLYYLVKYKSAKCINIFGEDINKSLELNFWPILYNYIDLLFFQTADEYLNLNTNTIPLI